MASGPSCRQRPLKPRRETGPMLPTQGPAVPVTSLTFSSSVSWETKLLACSKAASHPVPVAFAGRSVSQCSSLCSCSFNAYLCCNLSGSTLGYGGLAIRVASEAWCVGLKTRYTSIKRTLTRRIHRRTGIIIRLYPSWSSS